MAREAFESRGRTRSREGGAPAPLPVGTRVRRRFGRYWPRVRLWPLAAGIGTAIGLGWVGLGPVVAHDHLGWSDHLWYTLVLFKLSVPTIPPHDPALETAIWLAPLATLYALFRAVANLYYEQWTRFRVLHLTRAHVVVCGLGRSGGRLAAAFADEGVSVLAIDCDLGVEKRELCREHGVAVLEGDATERSVLERARLQRARLLVVVCGADATNAQVALVGAELAQRRRSVLACYVHVDDERLCAMLEQAALASSGAGTFALEFFNLLRAGPRALLDAYGVGLPGDDGARHLVVAGAGSVGSHVLVEAARRRAIAQSGATLRVTLVAPEASATIEALRARYPELDGACELVACDEDASDPLAASRLCIDHGVGETTTVFVCEDDDTAGVRATFQLRQVIDESDLIVLCSSSSVDSGAILRLCGADALPNVEGFALLDQVCRPEVLLNGERELIAQTIHASYVSEELRRGVRPASDPSLVAWSELPETLRDSNRDQAADIGRKLRAVGCSIVAATTWRPPGEVFSVEEVEALSRLEHERWMSERLASGWRYGPERDSARKLHPSLVAWESLDDDDRDRDREAVRALPSFLARAGFAVRPARPRPTGTPPALRSP